MPNDDVVAIAKEIDKLCDLQAETLQPERLKEVTAPQLKEYGIRRDRIKQLCAQLEKIGRG
jgi:hypothetical protein